MQQLQYRASDRAPPLVRQVLEAKGYTECEDEESDNWHLHWKAGRFKPSEYATASRMQRVNRQKLRSSEPATHPLTVAVDLRS